MGKLFVNSEWAWAVMPGELGTLYRSTHRWLDVCHCFPCMFEPVLHQKPPCKFICFWPVVWEKTSNLRVTRVDFHSPLLFPLFIQPFPHCPTNDTLIPAKIGRSWWKVHKLELLRRVWLCMWWRGLSFQGGRKKPYCFTLFVPQDVGVL